MKGKRVSVTMHPEVFQTFEELRAALEMTPSQMFEELLEFGFRMRLGIEPEWWEHMMSSEAAKARNKNRRRREMRESKLQSKERKRKLLAAARFLAQRAA